MNNNYYNKLRSFREEDNGITNFGLFHKSTLPTESKISIPLVKYHRQVLESVEVDVVIKDNNKSTSEWYSCTLYQQRNGSYTLKFKQTEISEA